MTHTTTDEQVKPPCDCCERVKGEWIARCYCGNSGSAQSAAVWCENQNDRAAQAPFSLTKRELFAAMAMQGMLSAGTGENATERARGAVAHADALLAALKETP